MPASVALYIIQKPPFRWLRRPEYTRLQPCPALLVVIHHQTAATTAAAKNQITKHKYGKSDRLVIPTFSLSISQFSPEPTDRPSDRCCIPMGACVLLLYLIVVVVAGGIAEMAGKLLSSRGIRFFFPLLFIYGMSATDAATDTDTANLLSIQQLSTHV